MTHLKLNPRLVDVLENFGDATFLVFKVCHLSEDRLIPKFIEFRQLFIEYSEYGQSNESHVQTPNVLFETVHEPLLSRMFRFPVNHFFAYDINSSSDRHDAPLDRI